MSPVTRSRPSGRPRRGDRGVRRPDPVEPRQPLAGVSTQREVEPDAAGELGGIPVAVELEQAQVGRAQVGVVGLEPVERDGETRPLEGIAERRRAGVEVGGVPVGGRGGEPRLVQALHRELPHRLEQPEPRLVVRSRHAQHERLVDERAEGGQDVGAPSPSRDDGLDVVEREPAAEDREPGEEVDLLGLEEVHAPVEHGGHGAVSVGQVARAGAEAARPGSKPVCSSRVSRVDGESSRRPGAASSSARGMPSSRRQIAASVAASCSVTASG